MTSQSDPDLWRVRGKVKSRFTRLPGHFTPLF